MHPYLPHTKDEIKEMLETIGVESIEDLFADIDGELKLDNHLDLPDGISEYELRKHLKVLANKNAGNLLSFAGGGAYDHYIPAIVPYLTSRQEFATAYTPYQPEISQGTLQAIYEYQSMIAMLTGLDVSNASHYDGATATAEAVMMASDKKRNKCLISNTVQKEVREVVKTYAKFKGVEYIEVPSKEGVIDIEELQSLMDKSVGCLVVQSPNKYGIIEDFTDVEPIVHEDKALFVMNVNPISLGILKSPKEWGADIAVGEGQVLGNPLNYGGAYLGFITCTKKLMRKLPGRIVGQTVDLDGKRGYVLTLQAREQHIRREKATSNITSNQGLVALAATIYMATMGKEGLKEVAIRSMKNARFLANELTKNSAYKLKYNQPFFNEFLLETKNSKEIIDKLYDKGIVAGIDYNHEVENTLLVATTEKHSKEDLQGFVREMEEMA